jgi:hypothetical protein
MSTWEQVTEYFTSDGTELSAEDGLIRGVKILGLESKNGRVYTKEAVARAMSLYEGVKVNVDHPKGDPSAQRSYGDRMGVMQNVRLGQGDTGLFGDFKFNPKHALAEQLKWDAQNSPGNVGFSHNALAKITKRGGKAVVEEITRVQSVDLVADPATTRGLFEATEELNNGEVAMATDTLTLEGLKADYPALVETIATQAVEAYKASAEQAAQKKALQEALEKLDGYDAEKKLREQVALVKEALKEANIPESTCSQVFIDQLVMASEADRKELIEDRIAHRKAVLEEATAGSGKPKSKEQRTTEAGKSSLAGMTTEQIGNRWKA